mgnify:CR=1 FL=1
MNITFIYTPGFYHFSCTIDFIFLVLIFIKHVWTFISDQTRKQATRCNIVFGWMARHPFDLFRYTYSILWFRWVCLQTLYMLSHREKNFMPEFSHHFLMSYFFLFPSSLRGFCIWIHVFFIVVSAFYRKYRNHSNLSVAPFCMGVHTMVW